MGKQWKQWQALLSWASKSLQMMTAAMKLKYTCSFLARKAMTNLDSMLKTTDITLLTKVHLIKAMVFPVVRWELDYKKSWAPKNLCFWTVVLEKTLESLLDCRRSNQSILKEISPGCSLEGLMLSWNSNVLATSCEELTHWKRLWCWEGLGAGGEVDKRGWDGWMASLTQWTWVWMNSGSWWWTGRPGVLRFMGS